MWMMTRSRSAISIDRSRGEASDSEIISVSSCKISVLYQLLNGQVQVPLLCRWSALGCRAQSKSCFCCHLFTGLPWVSEFQWGFNWVWVWDGYGDCDESPWVCGDSMGILNGCEIKRKRVKHALNVVLNAWISPNEVQFLIPFTDFFLHYLYRMPVSVQHKYACR